MAMSLPSISVVFSLFLLPIFLVWLRSCLPTHLLGSRPTPVASPVGEAVVIFLKQHQSQVTGKDPDAGKDWGEEEKGATEDEMVRWHHQLSGQKFKQTLGSSERQASLVCCSSWGGEDSDTTQWLNSEQERISLVGKSIGFAFVFES